MKASRWLLLLSAVAVVFPGCRLVPVTEWNAVQAQPDNALRSAQLKAIIRQMFDTASIIPYQYDSSRYVTDNKVQGWTEYYQSNNNADFYQPAELWIKTK